MQHLSIDFHRFDELGGPSYTITVGHLQARASLTISDPAMFNERLSHLSHALMAKSGSFESVRFEEFHDEQRYDWGFRLDWKNDVAIISFILCNDFGANYPYRMKLIISIPRDEAKEAGTSITHLLAGKIHEVRWNEPFDPPTLSGDPL